MVGMSLDMDLRQSLSQKMEIQKRMALTQRMSLELYLELAGFYQGIYDKARKEPYTRHGFDFEYAAIRKKDMPKKALEFGPGFAILRCNPFTGEVDPAYPPLRFVVTDYMDDFPREYRDLVAIHEYGESLSIGHRESSLLEWGIANEEGILNRYLGWIAEHFPCKIADLEHASKIYDIMPEELWVSAQMLAETSEEARRALGFIKGFDFPPEVKMLAARHESAANEIAGVIIRTGNDASGIIECATPDNVFLAAHLFRKAVRYVMASGIHNSISTRGTIEDAWTLAIESVRQRHDERRLDEEQMRGQLAMGNKITRERFQQLEAAADKPFVWYLPQTFAFAIETEKVLLEGKDKAPDKFRAALDKALLLAKGKIRISEDNEDEKDQTRPAFYIKSVIFEAIGEMAGCGRSRELGEKKTRALFAKKVAKIGQEYHERTGKDLFPAERGKMWADSSELVRFYKSAFSLESDETQKVVRFAKQQRTTLAQNTPVRNRAKLNNY